MTNNLEKLKAICDAATEGEWFFHTGFNRTTSDPGCYGIYLEIPDIVSPLVTGIKVQDQLFISKSRTALPILLEIITEMGEALDWCIVHGCIEDDHGVNLPAEALTQTNALLEKI